MKRLQSLVLLIQVISIFSLLQISGRIVRAQTNDDAKISADAYLNAGVADYSAGRFESAQQNFENARLLYHDLGYILNEANALHNLGMVYFKFGLIQKTITVFEQALAIYQQAGQLEYELKLLNQLGLVYSRAGQYLKALHVLEEVLAQMRALQQRNSEGRIQNNIGAVYLNQSWFQQALERFAEALTIARDPAVNDREGESMAQLNTGTAYRNLALAHYKQAQYSQAAVEYQQALAAYQQALTISQSLANTSNQGVALLNMGKTQRELGDAAKAQENPESSQAYYLQALQTFQAALTLYQATGDQAGAAMAQTEIGETERRLEHYAEALAMLQTAYAQFQASGNLAGQLQALEQLSAVCGVLGNALQQAAYLTEMGVLYAQQGQSAQSADVLWDAVDIQSKLGDDVGLAKSLMLLGEAFSAQKNFGDALISLTKALPIWQQEGDQANEGRTLLALGAAHLKLGECANALEFLTPARTIQQALGNRRNEGQADTALGEAELCQGQTDTALTTLQQALAIHREVGNRTGEGFTLIDLGDALLRQQRLSEALEAYRQALTIFRTDGQLVGQGMALARLGQFYQAQQQAPEALEQYQQAAEVYHELADQPAETEILTQILAIQTSQADYASAAATQLKIGAAYLGQGNPDQALLILQQALTSYANLPDPDGEAGAQMLIGVAQNAQGRYAEALNSLNTALTRYCELQHDAGKAATLVALGDLYYNQALYNEAETMFQQALDMFRTLPDRGGEGRTLMKLGNVYSKQAQIAPADQAEALWQKAIETEQLAIAVLSEVDDSYNQLLAKLSLAEIYDSAKLYWDALEAYKRALGMMHETDNFLYTEDFYPQAVLPDPSPIALIPTATPLPTSTPLPTATPVPTATPIPTMTPLPTATPVLNSTATPVFTATPVLNATVTPVPTMTPLSTATAVSTATPVFTATPVLNSTVTPVPTATPAVTPGSTSMLTATPASTPLSASIPLATPAPATTAPARIASFSTAIVSPTPVPMATASQPSPGLISSGSNSSRKSLMPGDVEQDIAKAAGKLGQADETVKALKRAAQAYRLSGEEQQALSAYEQLRTIHHTRNSSGEAATLETMADLQQSKGETQAAVKLMEEALAIYRQFHDYAGQKRIIKKMKALVPDNLDGLEFKQNFDHLRQRAEILNEIGLDSLQKGLFQEAEKIFRTAQEIQEKIGDQPGKAKTLNNRGTLHYILRQYPEARELFAASLEIMCSWQDRLVEATVLNQLGLVNYRQGQEKAQQTQAAEAEKLYGEALKNFQQALGITEALGERAMQGTILNNLGLLYYSQMTFYRGQGDFNGLQKNALPEAFADYQAALNAYQNALRAFQTALDIIREAGGRAGESATLHNLGKLYAGLGLYDQALLFLAQALRIEQTIGNMIDEGRTFSEIGLIHELQGRNLWRLAQARSQTSAGIWPRSLRRLLSWYRGALQLQQALNDYQQAIVIQEKLRTTARLEEFKFSLATEAVDVYQQAILLLVKLGRGAEAFDLSERARARTFLDQLGNTRIDLRNGVKPPLLRREQELRVELAGLFGKLREELLKPLSVDNSALIDQLKAQIARNQKYYADLLTQLKLNNPEYASLVDVVPLKLADVQRLLDHETTLLTYFVTPKTTLSFVITRTSFAMIAAPIEESLLRQAVFEVRTPAQKDAPGSPKLALLYEWLIAPAKPYLKTAVVGIIPHGILHYLPFAALTNAQSPYFGDDYMLFALPSASILKFIRQKQKPPADNILVIGNKGYPPLKYAEQEATEIANGYNVMPLVGKNATKSAFTAAASKAATIHISGHAQLNNQNPFSAGLMFEDGMLAIHEIYDLGLAQADLAVLSACNTLIGEQSRGDDIIALNRAFIYAGAPSVVASLWSVNDKATYDFMIAFHTFLRQGFSKANALRQARIEMRKTYPHPYYWAAFVLTGDPGQAKEPALASTGW